MDFTSDMVLSNMQQNNLFCQFYEALEGGHLPQLKKTVQKDITLITGTLNKDGDLALHAAVRFGHDEVVRYLVREYPLAAAMCNRFDETPFYIAINTDQFNLIRIMLTCLREQPNLNLNLNLNPKGAKSIVHELLKRSCWEENIEVLSEFGHHLEYLLESQEEGLSPLSWAIHNRPDEPMALKLLRNFPGLINVTDNVGSGISFPVHQALRAGRIDILRAFYEENNNSIFMLNDNNETILHLAAASKRNCKPEILNFLKSLPDVHKLLDICSNSGRTPIELAMEKKNEEFIKTFCG